MLTQQAPGDSQSSARYWAVAKTNREGKPALWMGLEPTGGYEKEFDSTMSETVCSAVFCVHPNQLHHFAQSLGQPAKTDKLACQSLALFVEAHGSI